MSLEIYFQGEHNAIGIVENGSELMENSRNQFYEYKPWGEMKSRPLTKPPGSLCDDEQLLWMSLKILE